jgi:hypothetical protein
MPSRGVSDTANAVSTVSRTPLIHVLCNFKTKFEKSLGATLVAIKGHYPQIQRQNLLLLSL